jgi:hypothetical protein
MKRTSILLVLVVLSALPAFAQSNEFNVMVGGSRRFVDAGPREAGVEFDDSTFALTNNTFELSWATKLEPDTWFRIKGGRLEGPVAVAYQREGDDTVYRRDANGEVQHIEANVEYRFSESYGSTGLFGGIGYYRQTAPDSKDSSGHGFNAGVNADFPLSRRYGIVLEGTYHWVRTDFQPRYLTLAAGLRVAF